MLEAAILSLEDASGPELQAQVDARVDELRSAAARRQRRLRGRRRLLPRDRQARPARQRRSRPPTRCITEFKTNNPPFSGGERDAINCLQLYRVTRDRKHLDLAKHYLDIRGLENSVNRSRHNQSYKPVLRADAKPSATR